MADERVEPFQLLFGIKTRKEVTVDGVLGLITDGRASKYNVVDSDQEYQVPGSFRDVADTWGRQAKPLVLFQHGMDPVLGVAPIGWGIKWEADEQGLLAQCFIPAEPTPPFTDNASAKTARYKEVYAGIKSGLIRHYSVGGIFTRVGKALVRWSMTELTICRHGALGDHAAFVLGTKAMNEYLQESGTKDMYAQALNEGDGTDQNSPLVRPQYVQSRAGHITRSSFSDVMKQAQQGKDANLHDHLLNKPAEFQGKHDAESCPICEGRRTAMGIKAGDQAVDEGDKAKAPDGDFLLVDAKGQHLRVRKNNTPDHDLMGGAYAALTSNFRGQPYEGPDKTALLARLHSLYNSEKLPWPGDKKAGGKSYSEEFIKDGIAFVAECGAAQKVGKRLSNKTVSALQKMEQLLSELLKEEQIERAGNDGGTMSG